MIWFFYFLFIYVMVAGIRISSLWNQKSNFWLQGRKDWYTNLDSVPEKKSKRIWFHVSSLGEFEQARPVIEKLKEKQSSIEIILSFFSSSGYTIRHNYPLATVVYLPADLPGNADKWITKIQPDFAVFVKYDLWPGYLKVLQQKNIPTILISAHWKPGHLLQSWSTPPTTDLLKKCKKIFLQKREHLDYFKKKGFSNLAVAGDTRIDRSLELPGETSRRIPKWLLEMAPFDFVAGSTWPPDEKILKTVIEKLDLSIVIAPHDVSDKNIQRLAKLFPVDTLRFSEITGSCKKPKVILIDNIGLLSSLYAIGKIAYIGGGFGSGIHNILEPMAHQKPLLFGPGYGKFPEAVDAVESGFARVINSAEELDSILHDLIKDQRAETMGRTAFDYLQKNAGATDIVTDYILESIPSGLEK